ncbi:hypothetical protein V3C99_018119 [Haemonchus contortus]|uniref:PFL domain-containing protein n=1 Tax=Haemonchus contortus TaxID=6289 RepID=A0A7I4Z550_HAECO
MNTEELGKTDIEARCLSMHERARFSVRSLSRPRTVTKAPVSIYEERKAFYMGMERFYRDYIFFKAIVDDFGAMYG